MRGGISRSLRGKAERARSRVSKAEPAGEGDGNRPVSRAGGETGKGFGPSRDPSGILADEASALEAGFPGKRQGLRAAPRSEWDFGRASARRGPSKGGTVSAPRLSKGRPEGLRPRSEPRRRHGFGRPDPTPGRGGGIDVPLRRPDGDRREAFGPLPRPTGFRTGPPASLRDPRRAKRVFAPASRSAAAQREMASPPSDGSQGWDEWGPVATPAPIAIPDLEISRCPGNRCLAPNGEIGAWHRTAAPGAGRVRVGARPGPLIRFALVP